MNMNKSGISANSGILNASNYNSNTMVTAPNNNMSSELYTETQIGFLKNSTITSSQHDKLGGIEIVNNASSPGQQ